MAGPVGVGFPLGRQFHLCQRDCVLGGSDRTVMDDRLLQVSGITKTFPGVRALDQVSFSCRRGEVHALVGENGAGKTTLMKILAGAYHPDTGEMLLRGSRVQFASPRDAQDAGISTVYQELSLLPYLSVAENIYMGRAPVGRWRLIDIRRMNEQAQGLLDRLGSRVDVRQLAYRLSVAQQQIVEIAKALSIEADLIIMDEPSATLAGDELETLFAIIETLRQQGITVIYVSHRLEEIFRVADRVTVLKDGRMVGTLAVAETDKSELIRLMVGRSLKDTFPERSNGDGQEILSVQGLSRKGVLHDVSFTLRRGEILGVAGLVGSGRTELARAIFGADPIDEGQIAVRGEPASVSSPRQAMDLGLGFVTEDRKTEGLILPLSVRSNMALPSLDARKLLGFVRMRKETEVVSKLATELDIKTPSLGQTVRNLSGGNQQKVVLGRWLATDADVIIFDEPTRGIDVGAKLEIHHLMSDLADQGKAILMISSELPEVLGMSDRILVLADGHLMGELSASEATEEGILALACLENSEDALRSDREFAPSLEGFEAGLVGTGTRWVGDVWQRVRQTVQDIVSNPHWSVMAVYAILFALLAAAIVVSPSFRTLANLQNIIRQATVVGILAVGQTFVILGGGIDVSLGAIISLVVIFSADFMAGRPEMVLPVVLGCVALGVAVGTLNGLAVVKLSIQPFVATLGMMSICTGLALAYTKIPIGRIAPGFRSFAYGQIGPVPLPLIFLFFLFGAAFFVLQRTRFGRNVYAVGGGREVARQSGINDGRVTMATYIIAGTMAAITGLYLVSRMGVGDPLAGPGLEWSSVTAVVIGGTTLAGGRGGIIGTLAGVLILAVVANMLNQLNVGNWYQEIIKGLIILAAVVAYRQSR
jgi:ribose transport system ATP-binding protein